jgi:polar amino acid transport system permease protein
MTWTHPTGIFPQGRENMTQEAISEEKQQVGSKLDTPGMGMDRWWLLVIAVVGLIIILVTTQPDPYARAITFMADGVLTSIAVTAFSFVLVIVLGLFGGLGRLSKNKVIKTIATLYVEIIRGIPLMVQIFYWYFAFPALIQRFGALIHFAPFENYLANPFVMAILGLTICYAAYMSEIYRAGIQSISKGQMEAARSLGMSQTQAMRHVILPQAFRVILPPMGNEFISLLKDSSLVSVVAVADLTRRGREFSSTTATPIETWTIVALVYLVMTILSARVVTFLEHKTKTS